MQTTKHHSITYYSTASKPAATRHHELAHASHYQQVGKAYWLAYIGHIASNLGYGDGDEPLAGYTGVGEIWGNFFGADCGRAEFGEGLGQGRFDSDEDW